MKTPSEVRGKFVLQWHNTARRVARLLDSDAWPLEVKVAKPAANEIKNQGSSVKNHLQAWRDLSEGEVEWQRVNYRGLADPVNVPRIWILHDIKTWVAACQDKTVEVQYRLCLSLFAIGPKIFHAYFVRRISDLSQYDIETLEQIINLVMQLTPGHARGKPLRSLSLVGIDSKFFERHARIIADLLDLRFDGAISQTSLEHFLDAPAGEHWILVAALEDGLLPVSQLKVRAEDIPALIGDCDRLLVVENVRCLHQLPSMPGTIAILGAGLDLAWLKAEVFSGKPIVYWGDMDTWGLYMLSLARSYQAHITSALMTEDLFNKYHQGAAVIEPKIHSEQVPEYLCTEEQALYRLLLTVERGRLEQEFISVSDVLKALKLLKK